MLNNTTKNKILIILFMYGFLISFFFSIKGLRLVEPYVHDEFSNIFQADTFLLGRLSNPQPKFSEHFETFHILMEPTFSSKYPPGIGLQLAIGKLLGHYLMGVWITMGFISVCTYLLSNLFTSKDYSIFIAVTGVTCLCVIGWGSNYFGGSLFAFTGLCSVYSLFQFKRNTSKFYVFTFGLSLGIMSITRPFEGFFFSIVLVSYFIYYAYSYKILKIASMIFLISITPFFVFQLMYNNSVTGDAFIMPHSLYTQKFMPNVPHFTWERKENHLKTVEKHERFIAFDKWYCERNIKPAIKLFNFLRFYNFNPYNINIYFLFVIFIAYCICSKKYLLSELFFLYYMLIVFYIAYLLSVFNLQHYYAAWYSFFVISSAIILNGKIIQFQTEFRKLVFLLFIFSLFNMQELVWQARFVFHDYSQEVGIVRKRLETQFKEIEGPVLFFVNYNKKHSFHAEWLYNKPDIKNAKFVWALDINSQKNLQLIEYLHPKKVLYLDVKDSEYTYR